MFRYQCYVCNSKTASLRLLLSHRQSVHNITQKHIKNIDLEPDFNDPNHYCKSCEKHSIGWPAYRNHLRSIHHLSVKSLQQKVQPESVTPDPSGPDYRCSSCSLAFQNKQAYQEHMKKHPEMKPSTASACNSHDELPDCNDPSIYCASCNFTYASKRTYIQHYRNMHISKTPKNPARSTAADLHNPKRYCKVCRLNFKTAKAFKRHSDHVHEHAKLFANPEVKSTVMDLMCSCEASETSYFSDGNDQRHLLTHVHQVNCSRQAQVQEKVKRKNNDDTNSYCRFCDKTLSSKPAFINHLFLIHSIRQPSKKDGGLQPDVNCRTNYCRVCQRSYPDNSRYRRHLRIVHQIVVQPPGYCKNPNSALSDSNDSKAPPIRKNTHRMALDHRKISNPNAIIHVNSPTRYCAQCERSYRNKLAFASHLKAVHDIIT